VLYGERPEPQVLRAMPLILLLPDEVSSELRQIPTI
jgi:hypothetical protein